MSSAFQASMPERIRLSVASGEALDVRRLSAHESISSLFHVTVVAISEAADLDFEAVAGRPASVSFGGLRGWSGVCSQIQQLRVEESGASTYELTIVPTLWLLTQRRNHRVFQQMTEIEIAQKILGEWGIDAELRLTSSYKKRKYRVQYGESDFTFLCRMLEDAGVSFHFSSDGAESRLVLSDAPHAAPERPAAIPFRDQPTVSDREHVTALHVGRRARPGKYTVRDHDYRRPPAYALMQTAHDGSDVESALETFEYSPGAFLYESRAAGDTPIADDRGKYRADEQEGALLAQRRLQATRATAQMCSFDTNAFDLAPGVVLRVTDHPRGDVDRLLVLGSEFSGNVSGEWTHHCETVSAEHPYRPESATPRPKVSGVESATVVGPPGEEIHTDEFGRVRVRFHWDREHGLDATSSCWIHVSQSWSGGGFGGINLPRVGQEVIVDFLGGDPDRPIIVGRVYTNLQKVPYTLPANKTQSGWKSSSTQQTGGYNEIMFEDAAGKELVRIQAEKDLHRLVKHDEEDAVGNDRTRVVKHDERVSVGNDRARIVQHDEEITVGNDRTATVGNDEALAVAKNRTRQVGGNEDVSVGGNLGETIGVNRSLNVGGNSSEQIGGNSSEQIGGSSSEHIGGALHVAVGSAMELKVTAAKTESVGLVSAESVGGLKTVEVGGAHLVTVMGAMTTTVGHGQTETIGTTKVVKVGDEYTLECGASKITVDKSGKVVIEAKDITLKATGPVQIDADGNVKVQSPGSVKVIGGSVHMN